MRGALTIRAEPPDQPDVLRMIEALDAQMTALYPPESNHLLDIAALSDSAVQAKFSELGAVTYPPDMQTPQALQRHLKSEIDKWSPIIRKAGIYAD